MQLSIATATTFLLAFTGAATVQKRQHPACAPYFYEGSVFPFDYAWGKYDLCCNYNGVNSASFKPGISMTRFPPIDLAVACPGPRCPGDLESTRMSRDALRHIAEHDNSHDYQYCWGYAIFRTVYTPGSDEVIAIAVDRLAIYAKLFTQERQIHPRVPGAAMAFNIRPIEELWSRYYCELVQDEQTLSDATESDVGDSFDIWIRQHRRPTTSSVPERNSRFNFCLMLDEESLENILAMPEDPYAPANSIARSEGEGWVKLVSNRMRSEDEGGGGRYWLRVGIRDFLWPVWFFPSDSDILIEEMGWCDAEDGVQNLWGTPDDWFTEIMAAPSGSQAE
ncbi:hypothetical protein D7B24_004175 [Verticillium nonalfalfae]|uniref:Uncharacterized protein n=1 Tax=Verticillium nonalfalfae TaxID=1051616 RepID=A0A3M9YI97_9PEZI|nr:uncharacterized protein D7B24_004175 [Verticillium nonalfalfae]RNJ58810.1 hypothetical protein D7B24_004175 [Verticillium nonalfalfae]